MALLIDFSDPNFQQKLQALQPTRGYCIFLDIVGSTELKDRGVKEWVAGIYNSFSNASAYLSPWFLPLKCIGDELMFFITENDLTSRGETTLTLFGPLCSVAAERDGLFKEVKMGVAYCVDAYEMTFFRGNRDVYGKDIDLTARLVSMAQPREIVMNESFFRRVKDCYGPIGNKEQFPEVSRISGPISEQLKGFRDPQQIYRLRC